MYQSSKVKVGRTALNCNDNSRKSLVGDKEDYHEDSLYRWRNLFLKNAKYIYIENDYH